MIGLIRLFNISKFPMRVLSLLFAVVFFLFIATRVSATPRYALVIGNGDYEYTTTLANPVNDASDIAVILRDLNFDVLLATDATNAEMTRLVRQFVSEVSSARPEVALFFYAGHGVQYDGVNYLLPINADISEDWELRDEAFSMDRVIAGLETAGSRFNLIMLDACRDKPYTSTRGGERGLSYMGGAGNGSMVVFATAPGDVAQDGSGRNSPFTQALLEKLTVPDLEVRDLVTQVQRSVQSQTSGRQVPWVNTSFTGEFYFFSAQEQLVRRRAEAQSLQEELASLEAEIAERTAAIQNTTDAEEHRRLEAEQQRARAREEAVRMEAERIARIQEQAESVIASQEEQERLRRDMEADFSAQQASLSARAAERRQELETLREQSAEQAGLMERFETITRIRSAISDVESQFTGVLDRTLGDLNEVHAKERDAFRTANPRDPWESPEEYEERIADSLLQLEAEQAAQRSAQERDLLAQRDEELSALRNQLSSAETALQGTRFTVDMSGVSVSVGDFDVYEKVFPFRLETVDHSVPLSVSLSYTVTGDTRKELNEAYYRVQSAHRAGGLVGSIEYVVHQLSEDIWVVLPSGARVVTLLEDDAEIVALPQSSIVVPGGDELFFKVNRDITPIDGYSSGILSSGAHSVIVSGLPPDSVVQFNNKSLFGLNHGDAVVVTTESNTRTMTISSPWIREPVSIELPTTQEPLQWVNAGVATGPEVGRMYIPPGSYSVSIFSESAEIVMCESDISHYLRNEDSGVPLPEGAYTIAVRKNKDPYISTVEHIAVTPRHSYQVNPGRVDWSTQFQLEESQAERATLNRQLSRNWLGRFTGYTTLGVGILGFSASAFC